MKFVGSCFGVPVARADTEARATRTTHRPGRGTQFLSMQTILSAVNVSKVVSTARGSLQILQGINLNIQPGESVAILGASGSGKTTLLSLLAGLDQATSGEIHLAGTLLSGLDEAACARVRGQHTGFVFQNFQLLNSLTALENVMLPMELKGAKDAADRSRLLMARVGLSDRLDHYPNQLSGGEQQRVAIARAFANSPGVLFADEPTGHLDAETGGLVADMMFKLNLEFGATLVLATHDESLASRCIRRLYLSHGLLQTQSHPTPKVAAS